MEPAKYYIMVGILLLGMALFPSFIKRTPITTSIVYLLFGIIVGHHGLDIIGHSFIKRPILLETIAEITVIISLFTVGLKLRLPLRDKNWLFPVCLATLSMTTTIFLVTAFTYYFFGFNIQQGILLGAILAPTDPVLSSDVQLSSPTEKNHLKFSLTAEGGMNDGTAFPFIMLALAMMKAGDDGWSFFHWLGKDLLWAVSAGIGIGALSGYSISKIAQRIGKKKDGYYLEDFLTIGSIALSYGVALMCESYGFLAVFANALMIRQDDFRDNNIVSKDNEEVVNLPDDVLSFNEQLERIFEVISVIVVGMLIDFRTLSMEIVLTALALFVVIRPVTILLTTLKSKVIFGEKLMISWFGVRGIGSIYYLFYAINHGAQSPTKLMNFTIWIVFFSILIHGLSVRPALSVFKSYKARLKG